MFNKKIVDYLKFSREFNLLCPGFETDIHGLVEVEDDNGNVSYFADCVAEGEPMSEAEKVTRTEDMVQVGNDGPYSRTI